MRGPVGFNDQRLLNVGYPQLDTDAATLSTVLYEISQKNLEKLTKYLRLDGSSEPTNDITMSDHLIKNLGNPMKPKDACTRKHVDDIIAAGPSTAASAPPSVGVGTINADFDVNNFEIINLKNPKNSQDAVNRGFVERNFLRK